MRVDRRKGMTDWGITSTDIGSRREVFWEETLIDKSRTTASLMVHHPRIEDIVMHYDCPWEGRHSGYIQILQDDDLYRMYYRGGCSGEDHDNMCICYAESKDGIHWEKPNLGLREFEGSFDNNIIMDTRTNDIDDNCYVFKDENPDCPAEEKYKSISLNYETGFLECHISADGIHFNKGWKITKAGRFDTRNVVFWRAEEKQYMLYVRDLHARAGKDEPYDYVRDVRWLTSPDFRNWSEATILDFQGGEDIELYTNEIMQYPRAPHMFIGFPVRYRERGTWTPSYDQLTGQKIRKERCGGSEVRMGLAITDNVFMCSRDGKSFYRYDEAFMRPGIERETNWIYGDGYIAYALLETKSPLAFAPDEFSMYCGEVSEEAYTEGVEKSHIQLRRYTIRKDGFASMHAPYGERKVYTKPIRFKGNKMELNFSTSAQGYVYIKVMGYQRKTLMSYELFGDSIDRLVCFDGDLSEFEGQDVILEFTMRDADIFSYRFFE